MVSGLKIGDSDISIDLIRKALPPASDVIAAFSTMPGTSALARILECFQQDLDESSTQKLNAQIDQWPAIIIDEANALTSWTSTHPRELMTLLRFFVRITKQQNVAHVLLVTSDYAFIDWLGQGFKRIFYRVQVIGDFRAEEARQYYDMLKGSACNDGDWRQVHEVCGGNAGLLEIAALDSSRMPLAEALLDIKDTVCDSISSGLEPLPEDGWTRAQYATAVQSILDAPANAVSAAVLKAKFGGGGAGKMVLQAFVRANLLACRPRSAWAQDIPSSAFGKDTFVIMAPTPADLACMRDLELLEPAPSAGTATSAEAPSEADSLESFLAELGLSEHLPVLQSSGDILWDDPMIRQTSLGWGINRPGTLAAHVNHGPVRPACDYRARVRPVHSRRWSIPAKRLPTEPAPLPEPEAPVAQQFFNRQHELDCLKALLSLQPVAISVIVGPVSSGKTALIQHYIEQLEARKAAVPIYIDCRRKDVQAPDYFAETLLRITSSATNRLPAFALTLLTAVARTVTDRFKLAGNDLAIELKALPMSEVRDALSAKSGTSALARVLELFEESLTVSSKQMQKKKGKKQPTDQWPVLIIDEANALTSWTNKHPEELKTLLRFLVTVTKQQNTAHVLLLTSDYAFIDWLEQGIGEMFYEVQVVGDFRDEEARTFFEKLKGQACTDVEWDQIYEVCGGNAGLLKIAAVNSFRMSLPEALQGIIRKVRRSVKRGLKPKGEDGWTEAQYVTAAQSILAAQQNAVSADVLEAEFGGGAAGDMVLQAMVRANLLAYRPPSPWARDIDISAFKDDEVVITAPTPAHLACMRELELPEPAPSVGTEENQASSSVELQGELDKVQQEIEEIAAEIKELKVDKPEGWQEDVRQLRTLQEKWLEEKLLLMRIVAG
ncbi:Uncharacterized ATP-binding protein MJ1659 at C-terminar half [Coccomyxa sp. Obi]|nr:Uncharacterized ATP-binding protein MJ1659 at C-terminar half [Coccomyxa sp. Obi]